MNQNDTYIAHVPGKIMLAGEYAVLEGGRALACTVDKTLRVKVQPRSDNKIQLGSELWGASYFEDALPESLKTSPLATTTLWAAAEYQLGGVDVWVDSDIRVEDGFGSSSALRLALLMALKALQLKPVSEHGIPEDMSWSLARKAWQLQLHEQSSASGYDVATQLAGGCVVLQPRNQDWPGISKQIYTKQPSWLRVMRGGKGAPTGPVLKRTMDWLRSNNRFNEVLASSEKAIDAFVTSIQDEGADINSFRELIKNVALLRRCFEKVPDFPLNIHRQLQRFPDIDITWTYKTTGAGGEDALIFIGKPEALSKPIACLEAIGWIELSSPLMVSGASIHNAGDAT